MSRCFFGGLFPSVALIYVCQFYRLACSLLHSLRQLAHPSPLLLRSCSEAGVTNKASRCPRVSTAACTFEPFLCLCPS
jgi:hypothetical protein